MLINPNLEIPPNTATGNLLSDSSAKNVWWMKSNVDQITYDAANQWFENHSDSRTAGALIQIVGNAPAYTPGLYQLVVDYTNLDIATGGVNSQKLDWVVVGIGAPGTWTASISLTGTGNSSIPAGTVLSTGDYELSADNSQRTTFATEFFNIEAGYDDLIVRVTTLGVGALNATDEFIRIHSIDLVAIPEPAAYAGLFGFLFLLGTILVRLRRKHR